jgi:hypothetical protein
MNSNALGLCGTTGIIQRHAKFPGLQDEARNFSAIQIDFTREP